MAAITSAVVGAGAAVYSARKGAKAAKGAAKSTKPTPYGVTGPAGSMTVGKDGTLSLSQANNPFSGMFNTLGLGSLANAGAMSPEVMNAYQGLFGRGLNETVSDQYSRLSRLAAPQERRDQQDLDNQLFARGMLGTTGGAERFRALMESQGQADLARQTQAWDLGQQVANQRFGAAMGNQLQQFNMGMGAFGGSNNLFQQLMQQAGLGVGAGGGVAPGAAMMAAEASGQPFMAGYNALQQGGAFDALGSWLGNRFGRPSVPMVQQPNLGAPSVTAGPFPMPSGNFGL